MDATSSGWPCGRHSRPAFLKSPTNSFFFVSTEMTGWPCGLKRPHLRGDVRELGVPVRMRVPSARLAIGLQAVVLCATSPPPFAADLKSLPTQFVRQAADLLQVHRNGVCGSPREEGSTKASSADNNLGCVAVNRCRPPPQRRVRPTGTASRRISSRNPLWIVLRDMPVALATSVGPPRPRALASAAAHKRRARSPSTRRTLRNFVRIVASMRLFGMAANNNRNQKTVRVTFGQPLTDSVRPGENPVVVMRVNNRKISELLPWWHSPAGCPDRETRGCSCSEMTPGRLQAFEIAILWPVRVKWWMFLAAGRGHLKDKPSKEPKP